MSERASLSGAERIVVKLGTNVVTHDGTRLALGRISSVVEDVAELRLQKKQVVVVSSGAVAMGMRALGISKRPDSLSQKQACAAVGQGHLVALYTQSFAQLGVVAAQVLLTQQDLAQRERLLYLRTTLTRLMELGVVPVLNENDSVGVDELIEDRQRGFGDNDGLSAKVAVSLGADLLVLLTDVEAVFDKNPSLHPDARPIDVLDRVDDEAIGWAAGSSKAGTGGMESKLRAARLAHEAGTSVVIGPGHAPHALRRILGGERLGTLVAAPRRKDRERRIALTGDHRGALVANPGALEAMVERKASLLPIGVVGVEGDFVRGDLVEVHDGAGRVRGRGLVNYSSDECRRLAGRHSSEIDRVIGWRGYSAVITRTNLVMAKV